MIPEEVKEECCDVIHLREMDVQHDAEHLTTNEYSDVLLIVTGGIAGKLEDLSS